MPKLDSLRLSPASLASNPRATLAAYSRFRQNIEEAAGGHPNAYSCVPESLEPSTFISRFRDAVRGLIAFDYPCSVSPDSVRLWWSEVVVATDPLNPRAVLIGPKKAVVERVTAPKSLPPDMKSFVSLEPDEFHAFCLLLSRGRLDGPVHVKNGGYENSVHPNVEVLSRPDGSIVLI